MILADQIESYVYLTGMDTRWKVHLSQMRKKKQENDWNISGKIGEYKNWLQRELNLSAIVDADGKKRYQIS
jgi:GH43 family beta-xylosidase